MSDYVSIRKLFHENKCALLSNDPLDLNNIHYVCSCTREKQVSVDQFRKVKHCNECNGKTVKLTYAYVKQYFEIYRCELVSNVYVKSCEILEYICSCGDKSSVSFMKFSSPKHSKKCFNCSKKEQADKYRLDYEIVYTAFEAAGCELLSKEYKKNDELLLYICNCGNEAYVTYNNFKNGKRCKQCKLKKVSEARRHDYDYVKEYFHQQGCTLLSKIYINCDELLQYECVCKNIAYISFDSFRRGSRCRDCGNEKLAEYHRLKYDDVKQLFKQRCCKLLSKTYINGTSPLSYICSCGNKLQTTYESFRYREHCCCHKKSYGEAVIIAILDKLSINYKTPKTYSDCKSIRCLSFDFYVNDEFLIEFAGKQHFESIERFGGDAQLAKQIKHDDIKNRYAITNNIPILHISYKEMAHIPIIIDLYLAMIKANAAPPITFTNRKLYQRMYSSVKHLLEVPKIPKLLLTSNKLPPDTESDYLFLPF